MAPQTFLKDHRTVQTDSNSSLGRYAGIKILSFGAYEIHPGDSKELYNGIYNDGRAHGDNNPPEQNHSLTGSIQISALAQGIRDRIEEALCQSEETRPEPGEYTEDQSEVRIGQVQKFQEKMNICDIMDNKREIYL